MKEKKDNKGRNNINKKDHQLKFTTLDFEKTSSKAGNQTMKDMENDSAK